MKILFVRHGKTECNNGNTTAKEICIMVQKLFDSEILNEDILIIKVDKQEISFKKSENNDIQGYYDRILKAYKII